MKKSKLMFIDLLYWWWWKKNRIIRCLGQIGSRVQLKFGQLLLKSLTGQALLSIEGTEMPNTVLLPTTHWDKYIGAEIIGMEVPTRINSAWVNQGRYHKRGDTRNREEKKLRRSIPLRRHGERGKNNPLRLGNNMAGVKEECEKIRGKRSWKDSLWRAIKRFKLSP